MSLVILKIITNIKSLNILITGSLLFPILPPFSFKSKRMTHISNSCNLVLHLSLFSIGPAYPLFLMGPYGIRNMQPGQIGVPNTGEDYLINCFFGF